MSLSIYLTLFILAFIAVRKLYIKRQRAKEAKAGILNNPKVDELFWLNLMDAVAWLTLVVLATQ